MTENLFSEISNLWAESEAIVNETKLQYRNDLRGFFDRLKASVEDNLDGLDLHQHFPDPGLQWWVGGSEKETPHAFLRTKNMFNTDIVRTNRIQFLLLAENLDNSLLDEIQLLQHQDDLKNFCEGTNNPGDLLNVEITLEGDDPIGDAGQKIATLLNSIAGLKNYPL